MAYLRQSGRQHADEPVTYRKGTGAHPAVAAGVAALRPSADAYRLH